MTACFLDVILTDSLRIASDTRNRRERQIYMLLDYGGTHLDRFGNSGQVLPGRHLIISGTMFRGVHAQAPVALSDLFDCTSLNGRHTEARFSKRKKTSFESANCAMSCKVDLGFLCQDSQL